MTHRLLRTALTATVLVALLAAAACSTTTTTSDAPPQTGSVGKESDAGPPKSGGAMTIGIIGETDSYVPSAGAWSIAGYAVANAMLEPLASLAPDGSVKPYLAESITSDAAFKTWTIGLRAGVKFHDGTVLDAAAVKKNLDAIKTSPLTSKAVQPIESIEAKDPRTVVVHMSTPWATYPAILTTQGGYMIAPSMMDDPAGANAKIVGTGPFVFQERQRDRLVKTTRNPDYWQKAPSGAALPYLDSITFNVVTDPSSREKGFAASDYNAVQATAPIEINDGRDLGAKGEANLVSDDRAEHDEIVLAFNTAKEPFDDITARQAVAYAIDQDELSSTVLEGALPGAWGLFEEGSPWYITKQQAGYPDPSMDKAKSLAAAYEKTHGKPIKFTLITPGDPQSTAVAQTVQANLQQAGIQLDISAVELTQLISKVIVTGDYQAAPFAMWSSPNPDQGYLFVATPPNPTGLSLNYSRLDEPALKTALDDFRATEDPAKQKEALARAQQELAKNLPMVFLYHGRSLFVYKKNVHGLAANTFPGTSTPAASPYPTTPFYTSAWISNS